MALDINSFISGKIKKEGLSKPYLFEVYIDGFEDLRFWAKSATMPASSINLVTIPFQGRSFKYPGERSYADVTITVINQENYDLRVKFERWMSRMSGTATGLAERTKEGTYFDITLRQFLSDHTDSHYSFKLIDAFPVEVSPIELSWENINGTQDFSVTFTFQYAQMSIPKGANP